MNVKVRFRDGNTAEYPVDNGDVLQALKPEGIQFDPDSGWAAPPSVLWAFSLTGVESVTLEREPVAPQEPVPAPAPEPAGVPVEGTANLSSDMTGGADLPVSDFISADSNPELLAEYEASVT